MTLFIRFATAGIVTSLLLAACGGADMDTTESLQGQWEIEQIARDDGTLASPLDSTSPFLAFTDVSASESAVAGNTGCNTFSGPVEVDTDGSFSSGTFMMTLMGCPDALGEQERSILAAMSAADMWAVDGDTASLSADGAVVLSLHRIATSLEGSAWAVAGINNQTGGVQSILADTNPTQFFKQDGRLTGTTGCNNLSGSYETDDPYVEIGPVATTRKFCQSPDRVMDQEQNMVAALDNAAAYQINGFTLNLKDADGHTMLNAQRIFEPKP